MKTTQMLFKSEIQGARSEKYGIAMEVRYLPDHVAYIFMSQQLLLYLTVINL